MSHRSRTVVLFRPESRDDGFTLLEVMFSVLILGVGLIGVAGLFPVAAASQQTSFDSMLGRQVGDSVRAMVETRGFSILDLIDPLDPATLVPGAVYAVPDKVLYDEPADPTDDPMISWKLADRVYPASMPGDLDFTDRTYYWVPLVRRPNLVDWQVFVFVMKKPRLVDFGSHVGSANPDDPDATPQVIAAGAVRLTGSTILAVGAPAGSFEVGDMILEGSGRIFTVTDVQGDMLTVDGLVGTPGPTTLWYAKPGPGGSPTHQILVFGNGVVLR